MQVTTLPETRRRDHVLPDGIPAGIRTAHPAADVYETRDDFVVELDVAGFRRHELTVDLVDHRIVVKGLRDVTDRARHYVRQERLGPRFAQTIDLPHGVDESHLHATCRDGLLILRAPRARIAGVRRVPIESSD